jgi:hypothetical protein
MDEGYVYAVSHPALSGRGGLASFGAVRLTPSGATCPLPPSGSGSRTRRKRALIAVMREGVKLVVKAASLRGHQSIDAYTLGGFAQAMERLQPECPGKRRQGCV